MYIDVNGRVHYTMLKTASGKTIGDIRLLSESQLQEVLDDGIAVYNIPAPPAPTAEEAKATAIAQINRKADSDIYAIIPESMIARAQARRTELLILEMRNAITEAEIAEAAAIDAKWLEMKAIRVKQQQDIEAL